MFRQILLNIDIHDKICANDKKGEEGHMTIECYDFSATNLGEISALPLAKHVVFFANQKGIDITNLKLQKVLYYLQGFFYGRFKKRLFYEVIEAWKLGPVVPTVYYEYNSFSAEQIYVEADGKLNPLEEEEKAYIDEVILDHARLSPSELVSRTHKEEPWVKASKQGLGTGHVIPYESIAECFSGRV